jgi:hypothetical protein
MARKSFVIFFALLLAALWGTGTSAAQSTSPDGLQLTNFSITPTQATVGTTVRVTFALKNTTTQPITFSPEFGVFVGARWNSTSDANNRDFGHRYKGTVVQPGARVVVKATRILDAAGTWRFWPAYNVNGHWGPFRWNEITVQVTGSQPPPRPRPPTTGGK